MRPIIDRAARLAQLRELLSYSPVVAILGPRQCGKTTLAKMIAADHYFDLENPRDLARLEKTPHGALKVICETLFSSKANVTNRNHSMNFSFNIELCLL